MKINLGFEIGVDAELWMERGVLGFFSRLAIREKIST